jgi:hypothetical protein
MDPRTKALLVVTLNLDGGINESEFNRWYFEEHVADRLQCPGFVDATRFEVSAQAASSADKHPAAPSRFLAIYELESAAALETEEYLQLRRHPSEKARIMLAAMQDVQRSTYTRLELAAPRSSSE